MRYQFSIVAHGEAFDVDGFAESTSMDISTVWHRGEQAFRSNGLEIDLAHDRILSPPDQQAVAARFIEANLDELTRLGKYPGVDSYVLGIRWVVPLTDDLLGFCIAFSPEVIALAVQVGLSPNAYVDLVRQSEPA